MKTFLRNWEWASKLNPKWYLNLLKSNPLGCLEGVLGRSWRLLGPLGWSFGVVLDVVLGFDSLIRFIDPISIQWFDSMMRFVDSIGWFYSWLRLIDSILWFDSSLGGSWALWTVFWGRFGCCFYSSIRFRFSESIQWCDSSILLVDSVRGLDSLIRFFDSIYPLMCGYVCFWVAKEFDAIFQFIDSFYWSDSSMRFVQNMMIDLHSLCTAWRNARSDSIRRPPRRGGAERARSKA